MGWVDGFGQSEVRVEMIKNLYQMLWPTKFELADSKEIFDEVFDLLVFSVSEICGLSDLSFSLFIISWHMGI